MISPSKSGAQNVLLPPARFVHEHIYLAKGGELVIWFEVGGIDPESATDEQLDDQHTIMHTAERALPEQFRCYDYFIKEDGAILPDPVPVANPVVRETLQRRVTFMRNHPDHPLSRITLVKALVYEPSGLPDAWIGNRNSLTVQADKLQSDIETVLTVARSYAANLRNLLNLRLMLRDEIFSMLRFLVCFDRDLAAVETCKYDNNLDCWMRSVPFTVQPSHIFLGDIRLHVLSLRPASTAAGGTTGLPGPTFSALLRGLLAINGNFLFCGEFKRESPEKLKQIIADKQDHLNFAKIYRNLRSCAIIAFSRGKDKESIVPDATAVKAIDELSRTASRLQSDYMGVYSLTGVFWDKRNRGAVVEAAITEAMRVFGVHNGSLIREYGHWLLGAYLSIIPGSVPGSDFRQRGNYLFGDQHIDLSLLYTHAAGDAISPHLQQEALLPLRTRDNTLYWLNLHHQSLYGWLIFGVMGSGKSCLANLIIDHSQKYNPWTMIIDGLGGSYRTNTRKHRGCYYELDPGGAWPFSLNPCLLPDTRKNRQYLSMLLRICMVVGGFRPNAKRNQAIYRAVGRMFELPRLQRRFSAIELPDEIQPYFAPWIGDGQYGAIFDNQSDTFELGRFQTLDFSAMSEYPDLVQPILFHFCFLWNQIIYDDSKLLDLKQLVMDESWKMIEYAPLRRWLKAACLTWRKRNAGMALITQSMIHMRDARMLDIINEMCPTKGLLYNPGGDFEDYARVLKLNSREVENYRSLRGAGDLLLKTPSLSKILHVDIDRESLWTYAASPVENARRDLALAKHKGDLGAALSDLAAAG